MLSSLAYSGDKHCNYGVIKTVGNNYHTLKFWCMLNCFTVSSTDCIICLQHHETNGTRWEEYNVLIVLWKFKRKIVMCVILIFMAKDALCCFSAQQHVGYHQQCIVVPTFHLMCFVLCLILWSGCCLLIRSVLFTTFLGVDDICLHKVMCVPG